MLCLAYADCDARADRELGWQGFYCDLLASVDLQNQGDSESLMLCVACMIFFGAKASWAVKTSNGLHVLMHSKSTTCYQVANG